jgi:ABC-2 type transport system ATP-binding protein
VAQDTIANMTQRNAPNGWWCRSDGQCPVRDKLAGVSGVKKIKRDDASDGVNRYEIECEPGRDVRRDLAQAVVQNGWGVLELRVQDLTLEEVFLNLTKEEGGAVS